MGPTQNEHTTKDDTTEGSTKKPDRPEKPVTVTVDEDLVTVPGDTTPRAVLLAADLDPGQRQLVRIQGKHQHPFADPDQDLKVHEGEQFITVSTGGTPVS